MRGAKKTQRRGLGGAWAKSLCGCGRGAAPRHEVWRRAAGALICAGARGVSNDSRGRVLNPSQTILKTHLKRILRVSQTNPEGISKESRWKYRCAARDAKAAPGPRDAQAAPGPRDAQAAPGPRGREISSPFSHPGEVLGAFPTNPSGGTEGISNNL